MNDNVEDLTELRLRSLEKIKENKTKVAHEYNKKVKQKNSKLEIWFGKRCYHWGLKIQRMANGLQTGTGRIGLTKSYLGTHICLRSYMCQVPGGSQWSTSQEVLPKYVG
jgi:hypothetical protein